MMKRKVNEYPKLKIIPGPVWYLATKFFNVRSGYLMDYGDYISAGYIGYLKALQKDQAHFSETEFKKFVFEKIKFEIIDEVNKFNQKKYYGRKRIPIIPEFLHYIDNLEFYVNLDDILISKQYEYILKSKINSLSNRNKYILNEFYSKNKKNEEIGAEIGITKRRIFQIKQNILNEFKEHFAGIG